MTVEQAKVMGVCRICGFPAERFLYDYSMVYNYGKEHAHKDCLEGRSESGGVSQRIADELRAEIKRLKHERKELLRANGTDRISQTRESRSRRRS